MPELIGVVLCGGQSSRMGRDKGLISENGKTWAERARDALVSLCNRVVYSINPQQLSAYTDTLKNAELVVDTFTGIGPLGGLLSVHKKYPDANLLLLACDMTSVTEADILPLLAAKGGIVAYRQGDIFEPLCAYYSAEVLGKMSQLYSEGRIPVGLQKILHLPEFNVAAIQSQNPGHLKSRNEPL